MTISLGSVMGGPEYDDHDADKMFSRIGILFEEKRQHGPNIGLLNVVFHFPGTQGKPRYSGIRTGKFSKRQKILMIQVAVPAETVISKDLDRFIFDSIRESFQLGLPVFKKAGITFSTKNAEALVSEVEQVYFSND